MYKYPIQLSVAIEYWLRIPAEIWCTQSLDWEEHTQGDPIIRFWVLVAHTHTRKCTGHGGTYWSKQLPALGTWGGGVKLKDKSPEQRLNLSRSWHKRPLSCLQYLVLYLSRIQRICPSRYLNLFQSRLDFLWWKTESRNNVMILGTKERLCVFMITSGRATYRRFPAWILA